MHQTHETKMNVIRNNISSLVHKRIKKKYQVHARETQNLYRSSLSQCKKHNLDRIKIAYKYGLRHFGENYVQEALGKIQHFNPPDINWHFIGPIQSNKTRVNSK